MRKLFFVLFYAFFLLFSCQKENKQVVSKENKVNDTVTKNKNVIIEKKKQSIRLDTFTTLPSEIDDSGGCLFSLSKEDMQAKKYICVNNLANLAYISLNGNIIEFKLLRYDEHNDTYFYSNKETSLKIIVERNKSIDDETSNIEGKIIVERGADMLSVKFTGICGF